MAEGPDADRPPVDERNILRKDCANLANCCRTAVANEAIAECHSSGNRTKLVDHRGGRRSAPNASQGASGERGGGDVPRRGHRSSRAAHGRAENAAALDAACELIVESLNAGGIVQAFGTGHSEAFAMEIAGRAGGLIPTNRIALRDVVLHGDRDVSVLSGASLERDATVVAELLDGVPLHPADVFIIASNSGVNGSIVEMALGAKRRGHGVIAVTSIEQPTQFPSSIRAASASPKSPTS